MIIGLSGKKQSGKSSCAKWILATFLKYTNLVTGAGVNEAGELIVEYLLDDGTALSEKVDIDKGHFLLDEIRPFAATFSFADELKASARIIFGLSYESLYGTDEQKNAPTHIKWSNVKKLLPKKVAEQFERENIIIKDGYVTGRGMCQIWGTDICRTIRDDCWLQATIENIKQYGGSISIIPDVRYPHEVEAIQSAGGKVIRLLRKKQEDSHSSETGLDNFPLEKFDKVIDNTNFDMSELCKSLYFALKEFDALPFTIQG